MTVASVPPIPYAAGPGCAPAESGPTRSAPPSSAHAIDPPPALTECTLTIGRPSGTPATCASVVVSARPETIAATSVLVPPMSKLSTSAKPLAAATHEAPTTPPAGPDRTQAAPLRAACSSSSTPPDERITSGAGNPAARARSPSRCR